MDINVAKLRLDAINVALMAGSSWRTVTISTASTPMPYPQARWRMRAISATPGGSSSKLTVLVRTASS